MAGGTGLQLGRTWAPAAWGYSGEVFLLFGYDSGRTRPVARWTAIVATVLEHRIQGLSSPCRYGAVMASLAPKAAMACSHAWWSRLMPAGGYRAVSLWRISGMISATSSMASR